jgi:hypothetical protein
MLRLLKRLLNRLLKPPRRLTLPDLK